MKNIFFLFLSSICFLGFTVFPSCNPRHITNQDSLSVFSLYKLQPVKQMNAEHVRSLASNLIGQDFNAQYFVSNDSAMNYKGKDASSYFSINNQTSFWSFSKNIDRYFGNFTPQLPDDKEAARIANNFLSKNKLMPADQQQVHLVHSGGLRGQAAKSLTTKDVYRTLNFSRVLDSLPVIGPGSRIIVHVGDKGEITGATYRWREVESVKGQRLKKAEVKSEEEARREAQKIIASEFGANTEITINKIYSAYFDQGVNYIQPIYAIEANAVIVGEDNNKLSIPYLCMVEAMKQTPEQITIRNIDPRAKEIIKGSKKGTGNQGNQDSIQLKHRSDD